MVIGELCISVHAGYLHMPDHDRAESAACVVLWGCGLPHHYMPARVGLPTTVCYCLMILHLCYCQLLSPTAC